MNKNINLHLLRGLAILLVFGYHIGLPGFTGGFIGVDIFFLISGYLITIKLAEVKTKEDLKNFYLKRVKKILPSLTAVLILTLSVFWFLYGWTGKTLQYFSEAAQSLLSILNITYAAEATATPYSYSPFLHLWSIAVETQFYITAPLILFILINKFKFNSRMLLTLSLVISLTAFITVSYFNPLTAYYASFGRIWEFSLGALIALTYQTKKPNNQLTSGQRKYLPTIFISTIIVFSAGFKTLFPEILTYSLIPVAAAAALIYIIVTTNQLKDLHNQNPLTKIATNGLNFLSDISYPLYLVHYPVLFFTFNYYPEHLITGTIFSLLLAYLIHKTIEIPFLNFKSKKQTLLNF